MPTRMLLPAILTAGFALFSMFFGSGNLVFPLEVGRQCGGNWIPSSLGLITSGVLVPALGALVVLLYDGSYEKVFRAAGIKAHLWFPPLALSLMGPFGVLPRCILVAQGSVTQLWPTLHPLAFNTAACVLIGFIAIRRSQIMSILGSWLTPVLLASLVAIVGCAYWQSGTHSQSNALQYGFMEGMFTGYQTMDLLAALFFATFVVKNIEKQARKLGICVKQLFGWVALVGMGLLAVVYGALVLLGSLYASDLSDVAPERLLCAISVQTLGAFSGVFICVVVLACLTTAIVLTALFAEYLHKRLPWNQSVVITLGIALVVSSLNFNGIAAYIGPILEVLYPAIVAVSLHLVLVKVGYMQRRAWLFPLAAFCSLMVYVA